MRKRLLKQFVAIVIGNLLYFVVLMPHLPPGGHHAAGRFDLGLLVDFWACVVVYGLIELSMRALRSRRQQ